MDVFVRTRGKQTLTAPLKLSSTGPARSWTLTPAKRPGRVDIDTDGGSPAAAELSGRPEELLLVLWGRLGLDKTDLTIAGDTAVANSLVPPR